MGVCRIIQSAGGNSYLVEILYDMARVEKQLASIQRKIAKAVPENTIAYVKLLTAESSLKRALTLRSESKIISSTQEDLTYVEGREYPTFELDGDIRTIFLAPTNEPVLTKLQHPLAASPESWLVNLGIYDGWQKFRPTYRKALVTWSDNGHHDIEMDNAKSKFQDVPLNLFKTRSRVPTTDGETIEPNTSVVVRFIDQDWDNPVIPHAGDNRVIGKKGIGDSYIHIQALQQARVVKFNLATRTPLFVYEEEFNDYDVSGDSGNIYITTAVTASVGSELGSETVSNGIKVTDRITGIEIPILRLYTSVNLPFGVTNGVRAEVLIPESTTILRVTVSRSTSDNSVGPFPATGLDAIEETDEEKSIMTFESLGFTLPDLEGDIAEVYTHSKYKSAEEFKKGADFTDPIAYPAYSFGFETTTKITLNLEINAHPSQYGFTWQAFHNVADNGVPVGEAYNASRIVNSADKRSLEQQYDPEFMSVGSGAMKVTEYVAANSGTVGSSFSMVVGTTTPSFLFDPTPTGDIDSQLTFNLTSGTAISQTRLQFEGKTLTITAIVDGVAVPVYTVDLSPAFNRVQFIRKVYVTASQSQTGVAEEYSYNDLFIVGDQTLFDPGDSTDNYICKIFASLT